jgi:nicotinamide-nucleotide amidase
MAVSPNCPGTAEKIQVRINEAIQVDVERIVAKAKRANLTLATVESCTAGALACALAEPAGAGETFQGGLVVYTKESKSVAAGVPADLIVQHTAVSAPVARAMAEGGLERMPADIAIAITGVAGPEPDEDGNPVGLVYIAAARRNRQVLAEELWLEGSKQEICAQAMSAALRLAERLTD